MKFLDRNLARAVWLSVAVAACGVHSAEAQDAGVPIKNLRMPLEHYADGTVKMQLRAEHALVPETGVISATNVVFELFRADGVTDATITADNCRYDRATSDAESASAIRLERGKTVISGQGFVWNGEKESVKILSKVRVVLERDLSKTGGILKKDGKEQSRE